MKRVHTASLIVCIALLPLFAFALDVPLRAQDRAFELRRYGPVFAPPPCPRSGSGEQMAKYEDYVIRTIDTGSYGCLEVRKAGVVVYKQSDALWYGIGNNIGGMNPGRVPAIPVGADITGGGIPEAIVWSWSGGMHCCYTFKILELGKQFAEVAEISADHSERTHFEDLRHDGKYEFVGYDSAFAYWHASFTYSPAPAVVLRPDEKGALNYYLYHLAFDLMKRPPPTAIEFDSLVNKVKEASAWEHGGAPPELWGKMLDLIYTGHPPLTWKLLDQSWPSDKPGKGGFIGAFCDRLRESRYWGDLSPLLSESHAPPDCLW
jgi:hypothetical protein